MNDTYSNAQSSSAMYYNTTATSTAGRTQPTNQPNTNTNPSGNSNGQTTLSSQTINDIYSQLNQLHNQFNTYQNTTNEKFNQFNLKLNYIYESMEATKRNVNELSQQVIYISQNVSSPYGFANQFKTIELFAKHINDLSKDLDELSQAAGVHHPQKSVHPQLQSQHHLNVPSAHSTTPSTNPASATTNTVPTSHFDDEVDDLNRPQLGKSLGIRSPGNTSNPTSPFIPPRFNFDLNPFSSSRNGSTSQQTRQSQQNFHEQPHKKKRRKESKSQDKTTELHRHQQTNPTQQQQGAISNYNMLPLPNLLGEGNTPSNKPGSVAVQYMSTIPPSELRHTNQSRTSFFGDDDIDHNIDELSGDNSGNTNATGTGNGGTTAGTAGSDSTTGAAAVTTVSAPCEPNDDTSSSNGDDKPSKKRKSDESSKTNLSLDIPKYRLERSLKSISDIWKEYEYGLNDKPPLKLLEIKYGTKWRNDTESRTFLRRKKIYDAIENGKAKGYTEDQIIQELEEYRSYDRNGTIKKKPLSWLNANMPDKYDS